MQEFGLEEETFLLAVSETEKYVNSAEQLSQSKGWRPGNGYYRLFIWEEKNYPDEDHFCFQQACIFMCQEYLRCQHSCFCDYFFFSPPLTQKLLTPLRIFSPGLCFPRLSLCYSFYSTESPRFVPPMVAYAAFLTAFFLIDTFI